MAKINFGDYLKSKQRKVRNYESDEALVQRAKLKLSVDPMVVSPAYRVKNLEAAEALLSDVKGYPGAETLYDSCKKQLSEAKIQKKEADYQRACRHLAEAKEEHEFGKAAGEFANLQGYRDADEKQDYARKRAKALNRMNLPSDALSLLEKTCSMGTEDFDALIRMLEKSGYPLREELGEPWIRRGGERYAAWYDLTMISPFFREFDAQAEKEGN